MAVCQKVMAKITKCFDYGNFHIHRCLKLFGRQYILLTKCYFAKGASFHPKTAISSINLKLPVVFICLKKTYNHILNTTVDACFNSDPFLG